MMSACARCVSFIDKKNLCRWTFWNWQLYYIVIFFSCNILHKTLFLLPFVLRHALKLCNRNSKTSQDVQLHSIQFISVQWWINVATRFLILLSFFVLSVQMQTATVLAHFSCQQKNHGKHTQCYNNVSLKSCIWRKLLLSQRQWHTVFADGPLRDRQTRPF